MHGNDWAENMLSYKINNKCGRKNVCIDFILAVILFSVKIFHFHAYLLSGEKDSSGWLHHRKHLT